MCQAVHVGVFDDCKHIDARSMYPTQMALPFIPNGEILLEEPNGAHYTIYYPVGCFSLKPGKLPYLQFRRKSQCIQYQLLNPFEPGEYPTDVYLDGSYALWEQELDLVMENYHVSHLDLSKKCFISKVENRILKPYVDELYKGK